MVSFTYTSMCACTKDFINKGIWWKREDTPKFLSEASTYLIKQENEPQMRSSHMVFLPTVQQGDLPSLNPYTTPTNFSFPLYYINRISATCHLYSNEQIYIDVAIAGSFSRFHIYQ